MMIITVIANYFILSILMIIISTTFLGYKLSTNRFLFVNLLFFIFAIVILYVLNIQTILSYLLLTSLYIIGLRYSIASVKLKSIIYVHSIFYLLNIIISYSITTFTQVSHSNAKTIELVINIVFVCLCLIVSYTKLKGTISYIIHSMSRTIKIIVLLLLVLCMLNIALVSDIQHYVRTDGLLFVVKTISLSTVLIIGIIAPIVIIISTSNSHLKNLTANYENQLAAQAEHYSALSKANFELRRFRHDLNNIKIGVVQLINEGKHTEAISMLDSANTDIYSTTNSLLKFDTGNGIVDALLADKQQKAASSNIKIVFEGAVVTENITATELCVIFGNTIDNAIEACKKIDVEIEKIINIICKCNSGFLFLNMSNPVREPIIIKNNLPTTTKDEKSLHGYGLYSLDKVIKKHHGELNLSCSDSTFSLDLSVCL